MCVCVLLSEKKWHLHNFLKMKPQDAMRYI